MPTNLLLGISYALIAIAGGFAVYYWRRAAGLYALLVEGANRFESLRQETEQTHRALGKAEEKLKLNRDQTSRLEKGIDEARDKAAQLVKKLETKDHEIKLVTEKLELQKGHLEKQLGKALDQIRASDDLRDQLQAQLAEVKTELETKTRSSQQESATRNRELQSKERDLGNKVRELEKERDSLTQKLKSADPAELKRYKRKLAQYDRLYASMRGLREMSDERNRNWEVALRKLSTWILRETSSLTVPESIGPLVGQALQVIGAQLVDDSEFDNANHPDSLDAGLIESTSSLDNDHAEP